MRVICYRNRHAHPGQSHCCGYVTPIIVAGLTIALGASCVAFYVLLITRNPTVAYTVALSVVFSIISIFIVPMVLWSYYVVVFTSPGFVPRQTWSSAPTYCPSHDTADVEAAATALEQLQLQHQRRRNRDHDDEEDSGQAQILSNRNAQGSGEEEEVGLNEGYVTQLTGNGELRFCHVCKVYKPDDAHHCSQCQRCVLKFDHHCPYINNCVGRNNYKVFLIFILYAGVGCTIAAVLMAIAIFTLDRSRSATGNLPWLAPTIILACIGLTLDAFYLDHRRLLARGDSSLTAMQKEQKSCMNGEGDVVCCAEAEDPDVVAQRQRKEVELARRHRRVLLGPPEERNRTCCRALLPIPARHGDEVDETLHPAHAVRLPNDGNGV